MALLIAPVFARVQVGLNEVGVNEVCFNRGARAIFDNWRCDFVEHKVELSGDICKPQLDLAACVGDRDARSNACFHEARFCFWKRRHVCPSRARLNHIARLDALSDDGCIHEIDGASANLDSWRCDLAANRARLSGYICKLQLDLKLCVGDGNGGSIACFHDAGLCLCNAGKLYRLTRVAVPKPLAVAPAFHGVDIGGAIFDSGYCDLPTKPAQFTNDDFRPLVDLNSGAGDGNGGSKACAYGAEFCCGRAQARYPPPGAAGPLNFPEARAVPELSTETILLIGFAGLGLRQTIKKRVTLDGAEQD